MMAIESWVMGELARMMNEPGAASSLFREECIAKKGMMAY